MPALMSTPDVSTASGSADPWAFQFHPEVWLLVGFVTVAYIYMVRVIGPKAVRAGQPVLTRTNKWAFVGAVAMLWIASDWPLHDISEDYLYSAHMVQHMALSFFLPPLALLATPTWLARVLLGNGRLYKVVKWFTFPVTAAVIFNLVVMVTHVPLVVNESVASGPVHYLLHLLMVTASFLMWMPVCGPIPEFQLKTPGKMIYLFLQSIVPTVPAAWLTFAEGIVYQKYDISYRLWGVSAVDDQQLAGAIMKVFGGMFLWVIIIYLFFTRFAKSYKTEHNYKRTAEEKAEYAVGSALTTEDVEREFARTVPPHVD